VELFVVLVVRNTVIGEDIDEYAVMDIHLSPYLLNKQGVVALDLCKVEWGVRLCAEPLKEVLLAKLRGGDLQETVVVLTGHAYIHIVIPRYNALVVEGSNGTSALNEVWNIVFFAYTINLCQNLVENGMESL
jgi:hypothetical protein